MQVKTNIRAGRRSGGADDNPKPESVEAPKTYVPPVSRCVGV